MMKVKIKLTKAVTNYMKIRRWSIVDLANEIGYSKQQMSQTLNGAIEPSVQLLRKLRLLTGLPINELIYDIVEK